MIATNCLEAPNYSVCEILNTLSQLMAGYYPLIDDLIKGLLRWPNLLIVTSGACILLGQAVFLVCHVLGIFFKH